MFLTCISPQPGIFAVYPIFAQKGNLNLLPSAAIMPTVQPGRDRNRLLL